MSQEVVVVALHTGLDSSTVMPRQSRNLVIAGVAFAGLVYPGVAARAQVVPGRDDAPSVSPLAAQLRADVRQGVYSLMNDWRAAWTRRDTKAVARLYAEDALLTARGTGVFLGRPAIRDYLARVLPPAGRITVSLLDFDYEDEGDYAYVFGEYGYPVSRDGATWSEVRGWHLTFATRAGRRWKIRAQLILAQRASPMAGWVAPKFSAEPVTLRHMLGDDMECLESWRGGKACNRARRIAGTQRLARTRMISWSSAWRRDDAEQAARLLSEQAVVLLPGEEPLFGRPAIVERLETALPASGDLYSIVDFADGGHIAFVYGLYSCRCRPGIEVDGLGRYAGVLKRYDGDWRIRTLIMWTDRKRPSR